MNKTKRTKSLVWKRSVRYMATALCAVTIFGLVGCGTTNETLGELSVETDVVIPRDDSNEIRPEGNRANVMNPITGGVDEEAEKLRTEILNAKDSISVKGKTYYISPNGDDINDGLSPENAFRSLDVLNWLRLSDGDAILLERGSVFRLTQPILAVSGVTYGAYGEGAKPCIYGSPQNYADGSLWSPSRKENVWKLDYSYEDAGNIVFNHGENVGIKKTIGLKQLEKTGDYYHNETDGIIYLYCKEGNPGKIYDDIEVSAGIVLFSLDKGVSNVTIDNLCLKYVGDFGVSGLYGNSNIRVTNCEMGYIGGSKASLAVRFGNAIQFWSGGDNSTVQNNWIYQVFDTAITFQGESGEKYSNITFTDNLLEYNDMDIEIWDSGKDFAVENLVIENNIMRFTAHGWGTRDEDAGNRGGASGLHFTLSNSVSFDATIKNNVFDCPKYMAVRCAKPSKGSFNADISGNSIYVNSNRGNNKIVMFGDTYEAIGQGQLETAFRKFDKASTVIKWLE